MKLRNILLVAASLCITWGGAYAQKKKTFYVPKAGTLVELLTENEANQITHLTLQGKLNAIDFRHLRDEFTNLKVLDISNATISMYTGKNGTYPDRIYVYPGNCIPAYAFCKKLSDGSFQGKQTLERVILSDKTKNIEDAAFKGCTNLKICQVRKKKAPNLLPEALAEMPCPDLIYFDASIGWQEQADLFEACLQRAGDDTLFVFEGIRTNRRMRAFWKAACQRAISLVRLNCLLA